ncbi:uncharacterized protein LOC144453657 [Glandiceps talaboti]
MASASSARREITDIGNRQWNFEVCEQFGVGEDDLKPAQKDGLVSLLSGHDVFAILPSGFGKSLIYQMYPHMLPKFGSVLIVSPLVSLMKEQIATMTSLGQSAGFVSEYVDGSDLPTYLYGSPEDYLKNRHKIESLQRHSDKIVLLVIDEVHTIPKWGEKANLCGKSRRRAQEEAFHEYFSHVGELRSFFPDVRVLALTATASKSLQSQIKESLIIHDCKVINVCPNKENIRYSVLKIPCDIPSTLFWMVDKLRDEKEAFPRTIVYCSSIDATAKLFHYFKEEYPDSVKYVGMYHSETDSMVQESHLREIQKESASMLRVLFCTTAFGMEIDIKDTHHVMHYGPSFDLESYIQESGRVGRDNNPSHAILLYHGRMLRDICPNLKKYIINDTICRRIKLLENFASENDITNMKSKKVHHGCCDVCEKKCTCGQCLSNSNYMENHLIHCYAETESEEDMSSDTYSLESDAVIEDLSDFTYSSSDD